jgi:hypothetical protein
MDFLQQIDGDNPEIQELTEAYSITIPCVKVFRRGIMSEYKGPYDFKGIAKYISEDSLVRFTFLHLPLLMKSLAITSLQFN